MIYPRESAMCEEQDDIGDCELVGRKASRPYRNHILIRDCDGKEWKCTPMGVELIPLTPFAANLLAALREEAL